MYRCVVVRRFAPIAPLRVGGMAALGCSRRYAQQQQGRPVVGQRAHSSVVTRLRGSLTTNAANDVVVVQHQDGTLHSTPFHVRFGGGAAVENSLVSIEVNGALTTASMRVGPYGMAYWPGGSVDATNCKGDQHATGGPCSVDLTSLGLVSGENTLSFRLLPPPPSSDAEAASVVTCNLFVWPHDAKIVVSDVDGTITKSDVLGHIMPLFGKDWTHAGLCSLYSRIADNDYEFVYLTARSLAHQKRTKEFLWSIDQEGGKTTLPRGPVLTAPDSVATALVREISMKSDVFKTSCLETIVRAFPKGSSPLCGGFGNRSGDYASYRAVNIPQDNIFVVNAKSIIYVDGDKQRQTTYDKLLLDVNQLFPPLPTTTETQ
ncbi:lipin, putative [Bodo saltans]|uniref:Lipin, putative n=1 Tax=Bodo saltans TaxID=75058 RepID=A0A0S4J4C7_BODSA|nr:lipin, putative [Bodo saltans]|eukprot:CUG75879.1 lipin, putative [Bodo saltans]